MGFQFVHWYRPQKYYEYSRNCDLRAVIEPLLQRLRSTHPEGSLLIMSASNDDRDSMRKWDLAQDELIAINSVASSAGSTATMAVVVQSATGHLLRRPHALTAKICFDMVPGFGSYKLLLVCWRFSRSSSFKRAASCGAGSFLGFHFLFRMLFLFPVSFSRSTKRARKVLNPCAFCFLILNLSPFLFLIELVFFDFLSQKRCICSHTSVFATQHLGKGVVEIKAQELGRNKSHRSGIGKTSRGDCHKVGARPIKEMTTSTSGAQAWHRIERAISTLRENSRFLIADRRQKKP